MPWYAVVDDASGRLKSIGTVLPAQLPAGLVALPLADRPNQAVMWDATSRAFVARPEPPPLIDRLQDLLTHDTYIELRSLFGTLTTAQKDALRRAFITLLGPYRYRLATEREMLE